MIVSDLSPPLSPTDSTYGGESQIIFYDLGGGSLDASLLSIDNGVFEVLAPPVAPISEEKNPMTPLSTVLPNSTRRRQLHTHPPTSGLWAS
jgi:hypothetical protein